MSESEKSTRMNIVWIHCSPAEPPPAAQCGTAPAACKPQMRSGRNTPRRASAAAGACPLRANPFRKENRTVRSAPPDFSYRKSASL